MPVTDSMDVLAASGMGAAKLENKRALFALATHALGNPDQQRRWFVPGRIEVLGKHTDYAGGRSFLCATERGMCVVAEPRSDSLVRVTDAVRQQMIELPLSPDLELPPGWGNYVAAVVRRIARNFPGASRGANIAIASDLPLSAGLSSSSVLVVAVFTALADMNCVREHAKFRELFLMPERLAEYLGCIENGQSYRDLEGDRGVGTFGGSEDHTAMLCSRAGYLSRYTFCPVTFEERVRMAVDWVFVVGSSGVEANKTGTARELYNRASRAARAVLDVWCAYSGSEDATLAAALYSATPDAIRGALASSRRADFSAQELQNRFDQFSLESTVLVPRASVALAARDMATFGEIVEQSQSAAERLLGNQVPETIWLARRARGLGACAASAFGAGFGGSVWALAQRSEADRFLESWRAEYAATFPGPAQRSEFFITGAGPGLTAL